MNKVNTKQIASLIESMGLQLEGGLRTEEVEIFLFTTVILGKNITGGIKLESIMEDGVGITSRFAICSDDDTFDVHLGTDIVIGRLFKTNGNDAVIGGDLSVADSIQSFISHKIQRLGRVLSLREEGRRDLKELETMLYGTIKEQLDGLV